MSRRLTEVARRIRAARAYADMTLQDVERATQIGYMTVSRMESGERTPRPLELREIARVCGLPYEWFEADFDTLASSPRDKSETPYDGPSHTPSKGEH